MRTSPRFLLAIDTSKLDPYLLPSSVFEFPPAVQCSPRPQWKLRKCRESASVILPTAHTIYNIRSKIIENMASIILQRVRLGGIIGRLHSLCLNQAMKWMTSSEAGDHSRIPPVVCFCLSFCLLCFAASALLYLSNETDHW